MKRLPAILTSAGLAVTFAVAGCDSNGNPTPSSSLPVPGVSAGQITIDMDRARAIATQLFAGSQVSEVEADDENNVPVWKVTVTTPDGVRHRVSINQKTGEIVKNEVVND